ncbi:MAG: hypothetical protein NTW49_03315 [Bacteroidia bacterium]|nr:hypothetical protein [Bacteroidia bacterium]
MNKTVEKYSHFRQVGLGLNTKMMNCKEIDIDIRIAGKRLKLLEKNTFILDDEQDLDIVMDFALFELLIKNQNFIERYYELDLPETVEENILLEGKLNAFTSLFEVVELDKENCIIKLIEVLESDKIYSIIDIGFSQTGWAGLLVFTRLIPLPDFYITGGVSFGFKSEQKEKLIKGFRFLKFKSHNKINSMDKYLYFFNQHRIFGIPIHKIEMT